MLMKHDSQWRFVNTPDTKDQRNDYDAFIIILSGSQDDRAQATSLIAANRAADKQKPVLLLWGDYYDGERLLLQVFPQDHNQLVPWFHHFPGIGLSTESLVKDVEGALFPKTK